MPNPLTFRIVWKVSQSWADSIPDKGSSMGAETRENLVFSRNYKYRIFSVSDAHFHRVQFFLSLNYVPYILNFLEVTQGAVILSFVMADRALA